MKLHSLFFTILFCLLFIACEEEQISVPSADPIEEEDTLFVTLPSGTFTNSSGETVEIASFQIQKNEVNNRLYRYLSDRTDLPHPADPGFPGMEEYFYLFPDHPVVNISAAKASAAAAALGARLPTRNEWEYAASLGLTGNISEQFPWGELAPAETPGVPANYMALDNWEERDLDGFAYTGPCGSYPLSNSGLADLAGNASEMVFCTADSTVYLMGGSWAQVEEAMTLGFTRAIADGDITWYSGFRLAK